MSIFRDHQSGKRIGVAARSIAVACLSAVVLAGCQESPESMLASAKSYLAKNDTNAASIQLKNALVKNGDLAEARFLLGKINLEQMDFLGAVKELQRAAELGYAEDEVAPLLARALVFSGKHDQVIEKYSNKKLDNRASQALLLNALGDAYMVKADPASARKYYEAAIESDETNMMSRIGLGRAMLFSGDAEKALAIAEALVKANPESADANDLLAEAYLAQNRPDEAVAALEAALRAQPKMASYHFRLISLLLSQNKTELAAEKLVEMKKVAVTHPNTLYLQAFIDFRQDRLKEARDGIMQVLKQAPDYVPAHLLAGSILMRQKEYVIARSHLNKVIERVPNQQLARRLLVGTYLGTNEPASALEALQPLLRGQGGDSGLFNLAGQVYLANGDINQAETYFAKAAAAAPDDVSIRTRLGVAKLAGGDAEGGFADLEMASGLDGGSTQADITLVLLHMRRGELDKALAAHEELARKQPNDPQTYNLKGGILLAKKDMTGARAAFEKALSLQPEFMPAAANLAAMDLTDKRPDAAKQRFADIIKRNPNNADAMLALANMQLRTGAQLSEVQVTLEQAVKVAPTMLPVKVALIQLYLRMNEKEKAVNLAKAAVAADPSNPRAVQLLGQTELSAGQTREAVASFTKLNGMEPDSIPVLLALADAQIQGKLFGEAEQTLRKALTFKSNLVEAQQRMIQILMEQKNPYGAVQIAKTIQGQRPKEAVGYTLEGNLKRADNKPAEAVAAYRKALELDKGSAEVAIRLHSMLAAMNNTTEADKFARDWLQANPKNMEMRAYLGQIALADGRYRDAVGLFKEMESIAPNNALVLNNLAWASGQLKDPQAMTFAKRALEQEPNNPAYLDTLGSLQVESGKIEEGLANLKQAVSLAPDSDVLRFNLAKAYATAKRPADARKELDILLPKLSKESALLPKATALRDSL